MANTNMLSLVVAFSIVGIVLFDIVVLADDDCSKAHLKDLASLCKDFVKIPGPPVEPSVQCCQTINTANITCACKHVTPEVEKRISMEKAVYITRVCGKPLTSGTKCGSYTVPAA